MRKFIIVVLSFVYCLATAQAAEKQTSSLGGTFVKNPMMWADVPDPDEHHHAPHARCSDYAF